MTDFEKILAGKDLRSIGKSNAVILKIQNQNDFDRLLKVCITPTGWWLCMPLTRLRNLPSANPGI